jgi:hypothetical protein
MDFGTNYMTVGYIRYPQASTMEKMNNDVAMGAARRRSEGGHDGGWRLRLVTVANCEAADR